MERDSDRDLNLSPHIAFDRGVCNSKPELAPRLTLDLLRERDLSRCADGVRARFDDASSSVRNLAATYVAKLPKKIAQKFAIFCNFHQFSLRNLRKFENDY